MDEGVAAGHGGLRASHADREHVIEALKTAFADGRLDKGSLDGLVGQTLAARTYAELAAVTADIPALPVLPALPAPAPLLRRDARPVNGSAVKWGLAGAGALIPPVMFVISGFVWPFPLAFVALPLVFIELIVVLAFVITVLAKQHRDRSHPSRAQLPPQPGLGAAAGRPGDTPSAQRARTELPRPASVRKTRRGPGVPVSGGARLGPRAALGAAVSP